MEPAHKFYCKSVSSTTKEVRSCYLRIVWLAITCGNCNSKNLYLKLVSNNQNLRNDADERRLNETRKLQEEVILDKNEEPEHHNNTWRLLVDNIPYHNRNNHGDCGACRTSKEPENTLARSLCHADSNNDHCPH
jgi:hypothetical protein